MDPDILFKQATELKKNGKILEAIEKLRHAYKIIENISTQYSIDPYLRLPMYLQEANKNDEAWKEFNILIQKLPQIFSSDKEILVMGYSKVYDKMRLFLQRENKNIEAIKIGILSYLYWGIGLKLQERFDEYTEYTSEKNYIDFLKKLLKKANKESLLDEFAQFMKSLIDKIPKIDIIDIKNKFNKILSE